MKIQRPRFLRAILMNCKKLGIEILTGTSCGNQQWSLLRCTEEEADTIPKDVPKGHIVVYVGKDCKRFVIQVTLLNHPLFRPLLDRAQEVYDFGPNAKLCIPCDESIFLAVVNYAVSQQSRRICRLWLEPLIVCFERR